MDDQEEDKVYWTPENEDRGQTDDLRRVEPQDVIERTDNGQRKDARNMNEILMSNRQRTHSSDDQGTRNQRKSRQFSTPKTLGKVKGRNGIQKRVTKLDKIKVEGKSKPLSKGIRKYFDSTQPNSTKTKRTWDLQ